jgi:hypothetical protein
MNATAQLTPERIATLEVVKSDLNGFINSEAAEKLGYLWSRWQDEKEYEPFTEYEKVMKQLLDGAAASSLTPGTQLEFVKGTKRPFGFQCKHPLVPNHVFAVTITSNSIGWKAIK